jgi:phospholipid/cholesterol/gamma-HCH transport system substrate-binding protein
MSAALTRPVVVVRLVMLAAGALIVVVLVSVIGGSSSYVLKLQMSNASGLRPGSQVLLGGIPVGTVDSLSLDHSNVVIADLHLNPDQVRVGRGASTSIVAANLLGEEYVALKPGPRSASLPSGTTLPQSATTLPTELDQIIDVLDGGTRARLAVLLREAGLAVAGRQGDVGAILRQFPLSLTAATTLLRTMVSDNHTLADLVGRGERFIARMNAFGTPLKQAIGAAAGATRTLADRAAALRQTVSGAPATLTTIQTFVHNLGDTAANLTSPAGELAGDAPRLQRLLAAVRPFTRAAVPTLNRAAAVAPTLTRLAKRATPLVKASLPAVFSLQRIATLARPLSAWLGLSAQDTVAIMSNWARAIQFRDGVSHVFNANFYLDPSIVLNIADQGAPPLQKCENLLDVKNAGLLRGMAELAKAAALRRTGCSQLAPTPERASNVGSRHRPTAHGPARAPAGTAPASPASRSTGNGAGTGVGRLLGGPGKTVTPAASAPPGGASDPVSQIQTLLAYLLDK